MKSKKFLWKTYKKMIIGEEKHLGIKEERRFFNKRKNTEK